MLSPQEGLEIALKRGDFNLARPYANRMLRLDPDDANANFAVGMWAIENHLYGIALTYLESAARSRQLTQTAVCAIIPTVHGTSLAH